MGPAPARCTRIGPSSLLGLNLAFCARRGQGGCAAAKVDRGVNAPDKVHWNVEKGGSASLRRIIEGGGIYLVWALHRR